MEILSPLSNSASDFIRVAPTPKSESRISAAPPIQPRWVLYANVLVSLLQPLQYGWSTSQLNLNTFNDEDECNARPVAPDTCLMFPGHTKAQWTIAVSAWIFGGMLGALVIGRVSNKFGRKRIMMANCLFMTTGAVVQASASSMWMFIGGRVISGVASGGTTAVIPGFISEISPPNLRNNLGVGFQMAITTGNLFVAIVFFSADTKSGWRYIAGFPVVLATLYLVLAPFIIVESPAWLLVVGKQQLAERELARLFGEENVYLAKTWLQQDHPQRLLGLLGPKTHGYQRRLLLLVHTVRTSWYIGRPHWNSCRQLCQRASNPVLWDTGTRLGNRKLMLYGLAGMFLSALGITASLVASLPALAIVFTATYVTTFGSSLGSLAWVVMADLFPDEARPMGNSVCVGCSWLSNLTVGLSYPYVAAALGDFSFTPFMCTVALSYVFVYWFVPDTSGKTMQEIR
ncbi:Major facilitator superfamily domain [Phytophthora cactorum]|nr:Major facilitator superfamily domain [Phytophthora cactorum]